MTTLNSTLKLRQASPGWAFLPLWIAATFVGELVYFIPVGAVHFLLALDRLDNPQRAGEITAGMLVLAAVLCGAACGSTIGLAQWFILRRQFNHVGLWVAATVAGYASVGLLAPIVSALQPDWLDWAFTLIINGKMHWLARLEPSWPAASWAAGAITLTLFGAVLGIAQWVVFRRRVDRAGMVDRDQRLRLGIGRRSELGALAPFHPGIIHCPGSNRRRRDGLVGQELASP